MYFFSMTSGFENMFGLIFSKSFHKKKKEFFIFENYKELSKLILLVFDTFSIPIFSKTQTQTASFPRVPTGEHPTSPRPHQHPHTQQLQTQEN